ncbi:MAG TPA: hypothetical protein VK796_03915 [Cytophaga sp.]|jgi:hypothetical protein|nr:hypothetical protein [Cytophaga sp.]
MDLITLQTFQLAHKAYLLKSILESEGIESYIYDEHIVTAQPMYANTVGGIKLKIQKKDFEKTCQILEGTEHEIIFQKEEEQPQNFAKHILLIIFSKETIIAVTVLFFILYLFYSNFF